jgi:predicted NUDIX family NTP pyrophosphohydrolase
MARKSAGILLYRRDEDDIRVLLVHPGGPYWTSKDLGAWSIPKGEYGDEEDAERAARREFREETGRVIDGGLTSLGEVRQAGGKHVTAFAAEGDLDPAQIKSNTFEMEWPPRSGRVQAFAEIDRVEWFRLADAQEKINAGQRAFLDRLEAMLREIGEG